MNKETLTIKGFEEHTQKEGLYVKKLADGTTLYADYRKEEPSYYATNDGDFVDRKEISKFDTDNDLLFLKQLDKANNQQQTKLI